MNYFLFFLLSTVGFLLISSLFRFLFGKKAQLGKAITSAMEILCLYLICIAVYSLDLDRELFQSPLPFLSVEGGSVEVFSILSAGFTDFCGQFAKLLLIAFLVNLMNSIIPEGKKLWLWLLLRAATVVLVVFVNYALDLWLSAVLPQGIADIAPLILLSVLVLLILLGSLRLIVGVALFVANPIIGALYTFFFSNLIGRALARALLSAGLLTALVYLLNSLGISGFALSAGGMIGLLPAFLTVILLWYGVDRIL